MKVIVNKNIPIPIFAFFTIFGIIIGLILLWISLQGFIEVHLLKISDVTTAKIVFSNRQSSSEDIHDHNNNHLSVVYSYEVDSKFYEIEDSIWWKFYSNKGYYKDNEIQIYYRKDNPFKSHVYHISYLLLSVAIILLFFLPVSLVKRIKKHHFF